MPTLTTTYLLPAILLNPAFVLHLFNTFVSHMMPPPPSVSLSPHPFMESLGPVRNAPPYLDMHADDQLCWGYTVVMVLVQVLAFGRVSDNRVQRKSAKAAKLEREKIRKEKLEKAAEVRKPAVSKANGHLNGILVGTCDVPAEQKLLNGVANGGPQPQTSTDERRKEFDSDETMTETSEEEMIP
ncbi:hypothetical protein ONS95_011287 [Cadophora gregata]|uniref:uncharacterized protein n=1 Tax=Cadophora gregata TaxID=51156 RepID=UPI0026DB6131|nr:uncharacterized protein ONS95_011287 [Cadophora gregata]KAK0119857.1 hypothetical protein ONS95_011287 [Cadophora gregata]KAK0120891.1 hypothetical protein ONS96_011089 [Cadophora gregata f. sp. sojae]